jgi:ABC-type uncharacterized transport system permease subunit
MEGKINIGLQALTWIAAGVCGFSVFFLARNGQYSDAAPYLGWGAAVLAVGAMNWQTRSLCKRLSDNIEDSN